MNWNKENTDKLIASLEGLAGLFFILMSFYYNTNSNAAVMQKDIEELKCSKVEQVQFDEVVRRLDEKQTGRHRFTSVI